MNDLEPLTKDEYDRLMRWAVIDRHLGESGEGWAETLWDRHAATVPQDSVERGAVHEAGHAVVAHACGLIIVNILLGDDGKGSTETLPSKHNGPREELINGIHIAMLKWGGMVAEELEWGMARYPDRDIVAAIKEHVMRRETILRSLAHDEIMAVLPVPQDISGAVVILSLVEVGKRRARWVLDRNRHATQRVADALLDKRQLGGSALAPLLADVIPGDGLDAWT